MALETNFDYLLEKKEYFSFAKQAVEAFRVRALMTGEILTVPVAEKFVVCLVVFSVHFRFSDTFHYYNYTTARRKGKAPDGAVSVRGAGFSGILFAEFLPRCEKSRLEAEQKSHDRADDGLKDLERELHHGVGGRAVYERAAERVAHDHYYNAERNAYERSHKAGLRVILMRKQRDDQRLKAVHLKRDEHRRGVEEEVAEKRADAADQKRAERVEQYGGGDDDDII